MFTTSGCPRAAFLDRRELGWRYGAREPHPRGIKGRGPDPLGLAMPSPPGHHLLPDHSLSIWPGGCIGWKEQPASRARATSRSISLTCRGHPRCWRRVGFDCLERAKQTARLSCRVQSVKEKPTFCYRRV